MRTLVLLLAIITLGSITTQARLQQSAVVGIAEMKMQLEANTPVAVQLPTAAPNLLQPMLSRNTYGRNRGTGLIAAGLTCMTLSAIAVPFITFGAAAVTESIWVGIGVYSAGCAVFGAGTAMLIIGMVQRSRANSYSVITPYSGAPNEVGLAYHF